MAPAPAAPLAPAVAGANANAAIVVIMSEPSIQPGLASIMPEASSLTSPAIAGAIPKVNAPAAPRAAAVPSLSPYFF